MTCVWPSVYTAPHAMTCVQPASNAGSARRELIGVWVSIRHAAWAGGRAGTWGGTGAWGTVGPRTKADSVRTHSAVPLLGLVALLLMAILRLSPDTVTKLLSFSR